MSIQKHRLVMFRFSWKSPLNANIEKHSYHKSRCHEYKYTFLYDFRAMRIIKLFVIHCNSYLFKRWLKFLYIYLSNLIVWSKLWCQRGHLHKLSNEQAFILNIHHIFSFVFYSIKQILHIGQIYSHVVRTLYLSSRVVHLLNTHCVVHAFSGNL